MFGIGKGKKQKKILYDVVEAEAQLALANSMGRLADGLEKFQDPIYIQKVLSDSFQTLAGIPAIAPQIAQALPSGMTLESITVNLSEEEREKMSKVVYKALQPQLKDFNKFVKSSLAEMPPHRLKQLATQIEQGAKPKLARRHGCVFVQLDTGPEVHLGL